MSEEELLAELQKLLTRDEISIFYWKLRGKQMVDVANKCQLSESAMYRLQRQAVRTLGFEKPLEVEKKYRNVILKLKEEDLKNWPKFVGLVVQEEAIEEPTDAKATPPKEVTPEQVMPQEEKTQQGPTSSTPTPPPPVQPPVRPARRSWWPYAVLIGIIVVVVIVGFIYLPMWGLFPASLETPVAVVTTSASTPNTPVNTTVVEPSATIEQVIPIIPTTAVPPTITFTSTSTPELAATTVVLFEDNFDDGTLSQWEVLSGSYQVINGQLTNVMDDPLWVSASFTPTTNYRISFDAYLECSDFEFPFAFVDKNNYIGAWVWCANQSGWRIIENGKKSNAGNMNTGHGTKYSFTVIGHKVTFYADGTEIGNIVNNQFPFGKIAFMIGRGNIIDNFKITQLP